MPSPGMGPQIRDCQRRSADMSVVSWCACHGITKANYYYRLHRVRQACLEGIPGENPPQQIVPVRPEILCADEKTSSDAQLGLNISTKGFSVHVTESTPMGLLAAVLEVIRDAE